MCDIALKLTFPILLSGDENNQAPVLAVMCRTVT
jgi:hypothetical protein